MSTSTFTARTATGVLRRDPSLVAELLRYATDLVLPIETAALLNPPDLAANLPAPCLPETVVVLTDALTVAPVLAVVVEPGDRDDDTMEYLWPVYVTAVRAVAECPTVLLVLAPDPRDAARCRRVIKTGHPGFDLHPVVLGPGGPQRT